MAARAEFVPLLKALFRNRDTAEWIHLLLRENIPVGPAEILTAPPPLGSDTEEILNRCLDISPYDVEKLREAGVI